jgi:RNA polymerase sigma-70 factor (ECF subfamily)
MSQEQEWIDAARNGDTAAFEKLIRRHQSSVYRSVLRLLRDRDEAEEIVQEAMVRAWENLRRFRGEAPFAGWLSRIAIYLALNRLRERKKFVRPEDEERHQAVLNRAEERGLTPLGELLKQEAHAALAKAMAELPEEFRVPLSLRVYEEYTYEQIAEALELPLGTVMSRLFRARERIAHRLRSMLSD